MFNKENEQSSPTCMYVENLELEYVDEIELMFHGISIVQLNSKNQSRVIDYLIVN